MRTANLVVTVLGLAAAALAGWFSWRWRRLPTTPTPVERFDSMRAAAKDAVIVVAAMLAAAMVAGFLVPGLVGRLLMRVLGATSGDGAQGRLTEADEVVGEITFGGSLGFVLFVGLGFPIAASFLHLVVRRILPTTAWASGLVFGAILLAVVGVTDPLSPDNVDFRILRPLPLAIALVVVTALLFGTTFAALASRFEQVLRAEPRCWHRRLPYLALVWLLIPLFAVLAVSYIGVSTVSRGRIGELLDRRGGRLAGRILVAAGTCVATVVVLIAAGRILTQ